MSDRLLLVISERLYTLFTRLGVSLNFSNLIGKKENRNIWIGDERKPNDYYNILSTIIVIILRVGLITYPPRGPPSRISNT